MSVDPVTLGIKAGMMAISYAMTASQRFEGPRLKTLEVTTADYGTPFPEVDGWCRIDGTPICWAEPLREKKSTSKTKGGKFANYKYFGTFATVAAGHEVDDIPRIWMDRHLVFDLTKPGPISVAAAFFRALTNDAPVKLVQGKNMRRYFGSETQEIDPRYEEWCEDRYGANSATARRGTAYVMFEEIPLEKFGNRIPQISLDVVNNPDPAFLFETLNSNGVKLAFSQDRTRALIYNQDTYQIWDVATRTKLIDGDWPTPMLYAALSPNGQIWGVDGFPLAHELKILSADGNAHLATFDVGTFIEHLWVVGGLAFFRPYAEAADQIIFSNGGTATVIDVDFVPAMYFVEPETGDVWTVGEVGTTVYLYNVNSGSQWTFAAPGGAAGYKSAFFNSEGNIFVLIQTTAIVVDRATMTVLTSSAIGGSAENLWLAMNEVLPGSNSFYTTNQEIDANDLSTIRSYTLSNWTTGDANTQYYEPITHSLWGRSDPASDVTVRYLDRITVDGVTLADVVERKCLRRGIPADAFDVSELTQPVLGYWTIQGTGAEQIAPCLDIHDVDATQHDYGLYFRTRGDASDALIDSSEFHAKEGQRFDLSMVPESRIPARVEFNYADNTADQQPNTASDSVPLDAVAAQNKKTFDLTTYVDVPNDAQPKVNRYLRRQWFERELGEAAFDITYGRLEPGDVKTIDIDGEQRVARFTELTRSGLLVKAKWVRDDPRVHDITAQAGPTFDGHEEDVIYVPSPTKAQVLEIPFLNDEEADDRPLLHYAAGDYGTGNWPGAVIWEGTFSAGEYEQWNAVDSASKAVWGYCLEVLPGPSSPWLWDRASSIQIHVRGTLTSATEAEILADNSINQAVIGAEGRWEIVNFTTAALLGDGIWEVSGFLRGRRGTEWACSLHEAGDEFWLAEDLSRDTYGLSAVGTEEEFKGQTLGRDPVGAEVIDVSLTGNSLKPYAPANLTAERDFTTGLWTITGRRRTRLGGDWVGGTPIPLSEASEAYDILIINGDGDEIRELAVVIEGDGNFSATYSASNQVTDFGSAQSVINVAAYQLSDAVGRGFPATIQAAASGELETGNIVAGAVEHDDNATVTPVNPAHQSGDTLLCIAFVRNSGVGRTLACSTTGWAAADGITNPTAMNGSRMWLFQNECDSDSEADPVIVPSGGSAGDTVVAVVLRIPGRNTGANFVLGTVSSNASNDTDIAFAQNSPSIDDGNAILAIGIKNNDYIVGGGPGVITGITAGLDWTELVDFKTSVGNDTTFTVDYAVNDSGSAYTAGTSGLKTATYSVGATSAGVYLEVPLL